MTERATATEIKAALLAPGMLEAWAVHHLGEPTERGRIDWRWGAKGSASVVMHGPKRGACHCYERGCGGGPLDIPMLFRGTPFLTALDEGRSFIGGDIKSEAWRPSLQPEPRELDTLPFAMSVWAERQPVSDPASPARLYLAGRAVPLPDYAQSIIGYHPACPRGAERLPAMVALMVDPVTGEPVGIHRIYLERAGGAVRKISHGKTKAMLGGAGVIRLSPDHHVTTGLGLAEGVETALSILGAGWSPIWAACSAGAIRTFPVLDGIEALTVFGDCDPPDQYGRRAGQDGAKVCALRWADAGREAVVRLPREQGHDWLDLAASA